MKTGILRLLLAASLFLAMAVIGRATPAFFYPDDELARMP